jgi:hypothetical protein
MINATGFHQNLRKEGTVAFNTNLYKIDRLIEEKQPLTIVDNKINEQLITRLLSKEYEDLRKAFSKVELNTLTPHRLYDHRIELKTKNTLKYNSLRQHSLKKLLITKKYIKENLHKDFIESSVMGWLCLPHGFAICVICACCSCCHCGCQRCEQRRGQR